MSDTTPGSAGSGSFMHDDAKELIRAGLFDAKHSIRERSFGGTKLEYNAELTRPIMALVRNAPEQQFKAKSRTLPRMQTFDVIPFRLPVRALSAGMRGLSTAGALSVGINLADAAIKQDGNKAIWIIGTTAVTGLIMEGVVAAAGTAAAMTVGEVVGGVFAAKDAYDAARSGHTVRAAASGLEAGLYAFSFGAALTGAGAPIALVTAGAAVTMTAARTLRDNWDTVSSWFHKWSNDFSAIHAHPTLPISVVRPRRLAIA